LVDYLSVYDERSLILCATDWHPSIKAHEIVARVLQNYLILNFNQFFPANFIKDAV